MINYRYRLLLLFFVIAPSVLFAGKGEKDNTEEEIKMSLLALDAQYANFYKWLAPLYDRESGGFRMAHSSTTDKTKYHAGIESTSQAVQILNTSGLLANMPQEMRAQLIHYYESRKDAATGFYYDTDDCTNNSTRLLARALGYSKGALRILKAVPPVSDEKPSATKKYADETRIGSILEKYPELGSAEKFTAWLGTQNWDNPWVGGDRTQARLSIIKEFPEEEQKMLKKALFAFLDKQQSGITGLWGNNKKNTDYYYISGAFKISLIYDGFHLSVPSVNKIYSSILNCLRNYSATEYCFVRNPLSLLQMLVRNNAAFKLPVTDVAEIIRLTAINNAKFLKPDGGFGRLWGAGYVGDTPCVWSAGLNEGDLNSGTQAINQVRKICYELAGVKEARLPDAKNFYEYLRKK